MMPERRELALLKSRKRRSGDEKNEEDIEDLQRSLEELQEAARKTILLHIDEEEEKVAEYVELKLDYDLKKANYEVERGEVAGLR